ncbi:NAD(P)H-hydrate dehydratase [Patescibacteria group bacterium]|nr:NAD(P)H-hydrate dehydratase [Patescibacteria group bacterium]
MKEVTIQDIQMLRLAEPNSHKGQNGRLLIVGGSHLFHAASIWALEVASRIVDLVHYSSVPENNDIVKEIKKEFHDGIVIAREDVGAYIEEDGCVLIGPGMVRDEETRMLTHNLLVSFPTKQWVIDAGALQMMELSDIPNNAILTPHHQEFTRLWDRARAGHPEFSQAHTDEDKVKLFARTYRCIVLLKGQTDIACSGGKCDERVCVPGETRLIAGGNEGMTKGGTGDVLAGLIAALACMNDPMLATIAGSFINKAAGDALYRSVGPFFNASDLAQEIPKTMKVLLLPDDAVNIQE